MNGVPELRTPKLGTAATAADGMVLSRMWKVKAA